MLNHLLLIHDQFESIIACYCFVSAIQCNINNKIYLAVFWRTKIRFLFLKCMHSKLIWSRCAHLIERKANLHLGKNISDHQFLMYFKWLTNFYFPPWKKYLIQINGSKCHKSPRSVFQMAKSKMAMETLWQK